MKKLINFAKKILNSQLYPISLYARQIAGTLVILFLGRYLSVYDYGLFSSYKTLAAFWLLFANIGYNEYILVSSQNIIREVQLKISLFIINAIFILLLISFCSTFCDLESNFLFILVLLRTFFDNIFFAIILPYFQASKKFNIISYVNIFYSAVMILITLISYEFNLSLTKFLILNIGLGLFNFIQVSYYAKINYILALKYLKKLFKMLDKSIFVYIGVVLCSYLYMQIPSLYTSTFISKEEAALYFAAFTISSVISLFIIAQVQKMVPEMIKATIPQIKQIIKTNLKFIISINMIIFIFLVFFGKHVLILLYSKEYYTRAYPLLLILTLSNISIALASIYGAYITASRNQHIKIKTQIEAIFISIIILFLFHKYKIYAAAIAYFLSGLHIGVRYIIKARKLISKQETFC